MSGRVVTIKSVINGARQAVEITMQHIGIGEVLQMQSEALNGVEKWAVLGHLFGMMSQMQQADRDGSLTHFWMRRVVNRLLDFGRLFNCEGKTDVSAHDGQFTLFVYLLRRLA